MRGEAAQAIAAVVLDIEGAVSPARFVHEVLLPYTRRHLAGFLKAHRDEPAVTDALSQLDAIAPGAPPFETLEALMDRDAKVAPLKTIQRMIWQQGFARGDLRTTPYPEIALLLRQWHEAGVFLFVYSSRSETAQRLLFRHTSEGGLMPIAGGFFDTRLEAKREAAGHAAILGAVGDRKGAILFLSDAEAELDAAAEAGFATCRIVDEQDGGQAFRHETAAGLHEAARRHGLPA